MVGGEAMAAPHKTAAWPPAAGCAHTPALTSAGSGTSGRRRGDAAGGPPRHAMMILGGLLPVNGPAWALITLIAGAPVPRRATRCRRPGPGPGGEARTGRGTRQRG